MTQVLYAARGSNVSSDLYTVDPATGAMTSIGPTGFAITGLAFDPTSGTLYGVTSNNSPSNPRSLITIDPTTGASALVGSLGTANPAADIAFNAAGQLYGWVEGPDDLYTINKATGAATLVANSGVSSQGDGMDFDSGGVLWACLKNVGSGSIYNVDTATGAATPVVVLSGGVPAASLAAASFDASGTFWAVENSAPSAVLCTINLVTGVITNKPGSMEDNTDGLAWGPEGATDDFSASLAPATLTIYAGHSDTTTLATVLTAGSAQSIALSDGGAPAGVVLAYAANPINSGDSTIVTVTVASTVPEGTYPIGINLVGSLGATHIVTLTLIVPFAGSVFDGAPIYRIISAPV